MPGVQQIARFHQVAEVNDNGMPTEPKEIASENAQLEGTHGTEAAWYDSWM